MNPRSYLRLIVVTLILCGAIGMARAEDGACQKAGSIVGACSPSVGQTGMLVCRMTAKGLKPICESATPAKQKAPKSTTGKKATKVAFIYSSPRDPVSMAPNGTVTYHGEMLRTMAATRLPEIAEVTLPTSKPFVTKGEKKSGLGTLVAFAN